MSNQSGARANLLAALQKKKHENACIANLIGKPTIKHWIDTSKWAIKPTKGMSFRISSNAFACHRIFHQWARISWERKL